MKTLKTQEIDVINNLLFKSLCAISSYSINYYVASCQRETLLQLGLKNCDNEQEGRSYR